eukprot:s5883_g1.t1
MVRLSLCGALGLCTCNGQF